MITNPDLVTLVFALVVVALDAWLIYQVLPELIGNIRSLWNNRASVRLARIIQEEVDRFERERVSMEESMVNSFKTIYASIADVKFALDTKVSILSSDEKFYADAQLANSVNLIARHTAKKTMEDGLNQALNALVERMLPDIKAQLKAEALVSTMEEAMPTTPEPVAVPIANVEVLKFALDKFTSGAAHAAAPKRKKKAQIRRSGK
jgi:hypothetical protein